MKQQLYCSDLSMGALTIPQNRRGQSNHLVKKRQHTEEGNLSSERGWLCVRQHTLGTQRQVLTEHTGPQAGAVQLGTLRADERTGVQRSNSLQVAQQHSSWLCWAPRPSWHPSNSTAHACSQYTCPLGLSLPKLQNGEKPSAYLRRSNGLMHGQHLGESLAGAKCCIAPIVRHPSQTHEHQKNKKFNFSTVTTPGEMGYYKSFFWLCNIPVRYIREGYLPITETRQ